jgi:hypothetical protein
MRTSSLRFGLLIALATTAVALTTSAAATASTDLPAPTNMAPLVGSPDPGGPTFPTLTNVRTGRHDCYDRTVFDFTGGTPGYRVEYGTLVAGGTGNPIPVAGVATLRVTFHQAYAHDIETGAVTYDTTRVLNPALPTVRQIRFGEDFEGVVTAGLGVNVKLGFRVLVLHSPDRVAVDVAHQGSC